MSIKDAVKTALLADAGVTTIFTGGVYTWDQTKRNGVSPDSLPSAYQGGFLKPIAMIRMRSETPWGGGYDVAAQWKSLRDVVVITLYDDGDNTYDAISSGADAIEKVLDQKYVANAGFMKTVGKLDDLRDQDMNNACQINLDFQVVRTRSLQ